MGYSVRSLICPKPMLIPCFLLLTVTLQVSFRERASETDPARYPSNCTSLPSTLIDIQHISPAPSSISKKACTPISPKQSAVRPMHSLTPDNKAVYDRRVVSRLDAEPREQTALSISPLQASLKSSACNLRAGSTPAWQYVILLFLCELS